MRLHPVLNHALEGAADVRLIDCPPEALLLGPERREGWTLNANQWQAGVLIYFAGTGRDLLAVRDLVSGACSCAESLASCRQNGQAVG
jgi:hypothetical protein